jgi:ribonuclease-3
MNTIFGYTFRDEAFLEQALRHSSAKTETLPSNERLEFLGDAVIGLVVSDILYKKFPDKEEGELTIIKSEVVSRPIMANIAHEQGLQNFLQTGKGIKQLPESILSNAVESIIGAIYLEAGLDTAFGIINNLFSQKIEEISLRPQEMNYKALLQHFTQKEYNSVPQYKLIKTTGPAHEPFFEVSVGVEGTIYGPGSGKTKKEAEQQAAKMAMEKIRETN